MITETLTVRMLGLTFLFLLAGPIAGRSEQVEHPAYLSWARHPLGTTIALRTVTANPNARITTTITYKLVGVLEDRVVLETRKVSDATGRVVEGTPERSEQKRWFPLLPGVGWCPTLTEQPDG